MMKCPSSTTIVFLLTVSLFSFTALLANSTTTYQLSCTRSFSDNEEVTVIYEKWHNRAADYRSQLRSLQLALYKVEDVKTFFNKAIFRQARLQQVPDSLLQRLPLIRSWSFKLNKAGQNISLGRLPSGVYILETIDNGYVAQVPIIVSNYNMMVKSLGGELLAFMVDKKTGQAVENFKCYAYLGNKNGQDSIITPQKQNKGLAYFRTELQHQTLATNSQPCPVIALKGSQIAVSSSYFDTQNPRNQSQAYLLIQSPAYRPQNWVRFKGIYRQLGEDGYTPTKTAVTYQILNAKGEEVVKKKVHLDENGTFADSLFLEDNAILGEYHLADQWGNQQIFQVQEYKKPEYKVAIELNKAQYAKGEDIQARIKANYFFGGAVKNATVKYKIMRGRFYTPWHHKSRFTDWYEDAYQSPYSINNEIVGTGTEALDANGFARLNIPTVAEINAKSSNYNENYTYTIFVEVQDASRRTVSSSKSVIVAETAFTLSATSEKEYYGEGEKIKVIISTTDFQKRGVQGHFIARLYNQHGLYSAPRHRPKAENGAVLQEIKAQTDAQTGLAHLQLTPEESGHYRIEITGIDWNGRKTTTNCYTYVLKKGDESSWWQKSGRGVHIFTDQRVYEAGDTVYARMYIPNVNVDALISLNNDRLINYNLHRFDGNTQSMSYQELYFVLKNNLFGKVNLNIDYLLNDRQYSQSKEIVVIPKQQYLNVQLLFDAKDYRPRQMASAMLQVTDYEGQVIPNANVTLSTVDESIYALYPNASKSINSAFYHSNFKGKGRVRKGDFKHTIKSSFLEKRRFGWRKEKMGNFERNTYLPKNKKYRLNCTGKNWPSHTTVVYGYVIDDETGQPIPNAAINVGENSFHADETGYYYLKNFVVNYATLTFSHQKGTTVIKNIEIPENECDISLSVAISPKKKEVIDLNPDANIMVLDYFKNLEVTADNFEQYLEGNTLTDNRALAYKEMQIDPTEEEQGSQNIVMQTLNSPSEVPITGASPANVGNPFESDGATSNYYTQNSYISNSSNDGGSSWSSTKTPKATPTMIRSDFQDAIYWQPNITTNADGQAKVNIQLPDDLTTWRTTATVITPDTKVGETIAKIVVNKGLMVRMETPRFMTLGDQMFITTSVHNYLPTEKNVQLSLVSNSLKVEGTEQMIVVAPNGEQRIDWPITSQWAEEAKLTVRAITDEESDALQLKVPVLPHGLEVVEAKSAYLSNQDEKTLEFNIRPDIDRNSIALEVNAIPSVTSALLTAMEDLIAYPYGCVEQTMSRFLPNVVVANTLQGLGKTYQGAIEEEELGKMVDKGVLRLSELQQDDGSWGWWKNEEVGNPFMTAYVCYGLYLAKKAGYYINEETYERALQALERQLKASIDTDPTSQAYQAMVAVQCGLGKKAWTNWNEKEVLGKNATAYQQALWLQTALLSEKEKTAIAILRKLEAKVIQKGGFNYWETPKFRHHWQTDQVETTANVVKALSMFDREHKQLQGAVEWLLSKRRGKSWHNTRQTAMTILGLSDRILQESQPNLELFIYANDQLVEQRIVAAENVYQSSPSIDLKPESYLVSLDGLQETNVLLSVLKEGRNTLKIVQKGVGTHFVNAQLKYFLTAPQITKTDTSNAAFLVERKYYKLKQKEQKDGSIQYIKSPLKLNSIRSGDDILVKVAIKSKQTQEFVLVEDPIPSGCSFIRSNEGYLIQGEASYKGNDTWNKPNKNAWSWSSWAVHRELRDDKLALTATRLPKGNYRYSYLLKAQTPGKYKVRPAVAQLMYYPEQRGFSDFEEILINVK